MPESCESDHPQWSTPDQVAKRLNIPLETLFLWQSQGRGPPWLTIGHQVRYDETDLLHWIETTGGSV